MVKKQNVAPDVPKPLGLRMKPSIVKKLDVLCDANTRSRPVIIEMLISKAVDEYESDNSVRIDP